MVTINPLLTERHHVVSTSIEGGDIGVCGKPSFRFWSIAWSPYRCKDEWRQLGQTFLESTTSFGICRNLLQARTHTHIDSRSTGIMPVSLQETLRNSLFLESSLGLFNIVILVDPKSVLFKAFSRQAPCCNWDPEGQCWFLSSQGTLIKKKLCMSSSFVDHFIVISHYSITMISTISIAISFLGGLWSALVLRNVCAAHVW